MSRFVHTADPIYSIEAAQHAKWLADMLAEEDHNGDSELRIRFGIAGNQDQHDAGKTDYPYTTAIFEVVTSSGIAIERATEYFESESFASCRPVRSGK